MFKISSGGRVKIDGTPFDGGHVAFEFKQIHVDSRNLKWRKSGKNAVEASADGLVFRCVLADGSIQCEVENTSSVPLDLDNIAVKFPPADMPQALFVDDWLEYIHPLWLDAICVVKKVGARSVRNEPNGEGAMAYILCDRRGGDSYLFCSLPPHAGDLSRFKALHAQPHLEGDFGLQIRSEQMRRVSKGETARSTAIKCVAGKDPLKLMETAGDLLSKGIKLKKTGPICGWNSWDYFAGAVTSKNIFDNLKKAKSLFKDRLTHFVIDEGYEPRWGIWEANWKFPEGLDGYCKEIRKSGCVPGIWTAPTLVNSYNEMYREHPEMFARTESGAVAQKLYSYGPMAYVDVTHPLGEKFIYDTFVHLRKCGFEYFKVDFTQETIFNAGVFHDRSVPRGMIIRKIFECIRRAIGKDAYLLACGAPFECVTGVVDACRVSGDIHNFWGHVCANAASIAGRWWMNGKLWRNDPDFLIVRTPETCTHPRMNRAYPPKPLDMVNFWLAGREFNVREAKTYALVLRLSGGDIFLSDDLPAMNKKGVAILDKATANPLSKAAIPFDMFEGHDAIPSIWIGEDGGKPFAAFINWTEDPIEFHLNLKDAGIKTSSKTKVSPFWGDFKGEIDESGDLVVSIPPRGSEGFLIG